MTFMRLLKHFIPCIEARSSTELARDCTILRMLRCDDLTLAEATALVGSMTAEWQHLGANVVAHRRFKMLPTPPREPEVFVPKGPYR